MSKKKYYAVRNGRTKGIYFSWDDCKSMVHGYPKAEYRSFEDINEALEYMLIESGTDTEESEAEDDRQAVKNGDGEIEAYVDGSYEHSLRRYGCGVVILKDGKVLKKISKRGENEDNLSMRNVAGEIEASMIAMDFCKEKKYAKVTIYHDYEGISKWCLGIWKTNKKGTKEYKRFYDDIVKYIDVDFVKVDAHTGVKYNEMADKLAKEAIY